MKWIILLLLSLPALAQDCSLYEFQGEVQKKGLRVALIVNKKTNSQREFSFSKKIELEMAPYFDKVIRGKFVIRKFEIVKIEEVKLSVPDPLYRSQEMVKVKTVSCPK